MKRLGLLLACMWLVAAAGATQATLDPIAAELAVAALTNQFRARQGLSTLVMNPFLQRAARSHSQEMARLDYFDHLSPVAARRYPWDRLNLAGADADSVSENLFMATGHDMDMVPVLAVKSWQLSPEHRANLMDPAKTSVGVGIWVQGRDIYVTQMLTSEVSGFSGTELPPCRP